MQQSGVAPEHKGHVGLTPGRVALNTAAVLGVLLTAYILVQVKAIIVVALMGILLAGAIEPIVNRLHASGLGRGQSVLVVYTIMLLLIGTLLAYLVPAVLGEASKFLTAAPKLFDALRASAEASSSTLIRENGPYFVDQLRDRITRADIPTERALTIATYVPSVFGWVIDGFITIVTTLMIGYYWITEKPIIKRVFLSSFQEERQERIRTVWDDIEGKLGGWIRGQLILMGTMGVAASVGYALLGLKFWMLLGLMAGLFEIIPFFGPWISGVPAVLIALTQSWRLAVAVVVFMVVMQMLEGNVLVPRVMKGSVGLSPLLVVLAVLVGVTILGPPGGIIAIPVAAALQVLIGDLVRGHQEALAAEARVEGDRVFRWRPYGLPVRLQGVRPGPAVVSPVVELPATPADPHSSGPASADTR